MRNEQELRREFEKPIENGESTTTDTISDSLVNACSVSPSDTGLSSPNTPKSSPNHTNISPNNSTNNLNGIVKKNALKATLSLDPATLYRGTIPYEKISFSQAPPRLSNADSLEMKKVIYYLITYLIVI